MPVPSHPATIFHSWEYTAPFVSRIRNLCSAPVPDWILACIGPDPPRRDDRHTMRGASDIDSCLVDLVDQARASAYTWTRSSDRETRLSSLTFFLISSMVMACPGVLAFDALPFALCSFPPGLLRFSDLRAKYDLATLIFVQSIPGGLARTLEPPPPIPTSDTSNTQGCSSSDGSATCSSSETSGSESAEDNARAFCARSAPGLPPPSFAYTDNVTAPVKPILQTHLFAEDVTGPCLCTMVATTQKNIYEALASVLYQRLSWGVRTPVIGLILPDSPDSNPPLELYMVVAWLAESPNHGLPAVHVAHSPLAGDQHGDERQGIFRLDRPSSLLALAQILISLRASFASDLAQATSSQENEVFRWRADQVEQPPDVSYGETRDRILQWLYSLNSTIISEPVAGEEMTRTSIHNTEEPSSFTASIRLSFNLFAAVRDRAGAKPTPTCLWLLDRHAFQTALPPNVFFDNGRSNPSAILDGVAHFLCYESATRFFWPATWATSADCLPRVAEYLTPLRNDLFALGLLHGVVPNEFNNRTAEGLTKILVRVLHMCFIARAASSAVDKGLVQAHCRPYYHALFQLSVESNVTKFRTDVQVALPRSDYVDLLRYFASPFHASVQAECLQVNQDRRNSAIAELFCTESDRILCERLQRANRKFTSSRNAWGTAQSPDEARERAAKAPTSGVCDSALALDAGDVLPEDVAAKLALVQLFEDYPNALTTPHSPGFRPSEPTGLRSSWNVPEAFDILATSHCGHPTDPMSEEEVQRVISEHVRARQSNPERASSTQSDFRPMPDADPTRDTTTIPSAAPTTQPILLPLLIVTHSVKRRVFDVGDSNRLRMLLTAAVKFLAFMGVLDFPTYGLLTESTTCAVVMAWACRSEGHIAVRIVEQNCAAFDIATVAGAFNLTTFLLWLQTEHAPRLSAMLKDERLIAALRQKLAAGGGWRAVDQNDELRTMDVPATTDDTGDVV